jgi:hypothetical protein
MPKNINRPVPGTPNYRAAREAQERRNRLQAAVILGGGFLLLLCLTGWAVSSSGREWQGWLGSLANKSFGKVGGALGEDSAAGEGDGSPAFGEKGRAKLGVYNVHRFDPITDTTLTVNFELSGQTACNDKASFEDFMQAYYPFLREQVMGTIRDCETGDLADKPGLARKMVTRVNRSLGRRFLKSVKFERMQMFETIGPYEGESWEPPQGE